MKPIIIANWKMNLSLEEAITKAKSFNNYSHSVRFLLAPPTPYISYLAEKFRNLNICAQNVSSINCFGAYTGEYSAAMLKTCGVHYAIIGHSERRNNFGETNKLVKQKALNCIESGITPIICTGETLEARKNGNYKEFMAEQIRESIPQTPHPIIIAYEPVWAIGSGLIPTPKEIAEIFTFIKTDKEISIIAKNAELVYGGSVNSKNYKEILSIAGNNGIILGSASLDNKELSKILELNT
jgi:triosephosphate isomerase